MGSKDSPKVHKKENENWSEAHILLPFGGLSLSLLWYSVFSCNLYLEDACRKRNLIIRLGSKRWEAIRENKTLIFFLPCCGSDLIVVKLTMLAISRLYEQLSNTNSILIACTSLRKWYTDPWLDKSSATQAGGIFNSKFQTMERRTWWEKNLAQLSKLQFVKLYLGCRKPHVYPRVIHVPCAVQKLCAYQGTRQDTKRAEN